MKGLQWSESLFCYALHAMGVKSRNVQKITGSEARKNHQAYDTKSTLGHINN